MKIIHVEDRFESTAGYQINELVKAQSKKNYEIEIITSDIPIFSDSKDLIKYDVEFEKNYNCKITRFKPLFVISQRFYFKNLFSYIENRKPDIVFLHGIGDFKDLILLKKKRKYLIVRDCHMSWVASRNKFNKLFAAIFSKTFSVIINKTEKYKKIYFLGREEKEYLEHLGIKSDILSDLLHGYNSEEMFFSEEKRNEIRKILNVSKNDFFIGYVGKLDKYKRPDLLLDIFSRFSEKQMKHIKLLFLGNFSDDYEESFYKKYYKFEYKDKCIFLNSQRYSELYKYYSALDICLWPKETTLSSIHAQVCQTIPVMEKHLSNIERVEYTEFLFEIDDIEDAYIKLNTLINTFDSVSIKSNTLFNRDYSITTKKLDKEWKDLIE